ncbi:hypothetical protein LG634_11250 [Streptomyces bambusae]|uniref:hypothetical protein n=1 Tax=Streptomyces bambusae TaxID=1550616 RepID=UPI001CFEC422|nr:hypothetical protein [Streptomyces bambusae]MCB5165404.1 hypothetical protein [Streptomyces bambusae]
MAQDLDIEELVAAMRAVDTAAGLLDEALAVYEGRGLQRTGDDFKVAGGAVQTLQGAEEMARGTRRFLAELAQVTGYATAGLGDRAHPRLAQARTGYAGVSGGGARMARPLLGQTVEALHLLLATGFFDAEFTAGVEQVLRAERATYPDPSTFRIPAGADR